jgi:hypothetical protein
MAKAELREAFAFYHKIDPRLRESFEAEFKLLTDQLGQDASLLSIRVGGFRRANFSTFPYYLPYVIRKPAVHALAVAHSSCHPDY